MLSALIEPELWLPDDAVARYLRDHDTIRMLSRTFTDPSKPSEQSKAEFDERTAAINITPTQNGRYNLKQMKDDALWLSQSAEIDEVSALRIVVLEWQSRPLVRLVRADVDEQGSQGWDTTQRKKGNLAYGEQGKDTDYDRVRRSELLKLFMHERQYAIEAAYLLAFVSVPPDVHASTRGRIYTSSTRNRIMEDCGDEILKAWKMDTASPSHFVISSVGFIESRLHWLDRPARWFEDSEEAQDLELLHCQTIVVEIIHALQALFNVFSSSPLPHADALVAWYGFMKKTHFLDALRSPRSQPADAELHVIRSLAALVSLAALKLSDVLSALPSWAALVNTTNESDNAQPYIRNLLCVEQITSCLWEAVATPTPSAGLAMLAWSIILSAIADIASSSQETRDTRQSQLAIDRYEHAQRSGSDGTPETSAARAPSRRSSLSSDFSQQQQTLLEDVVDRVKDVTQGENSMMEFAQTSVDKLRALNMIEDLSMLFSTGISSDTHGEFGLRARSAFLALLRGSLDFVDYQEVTVDCCLTILTGGTSYWDRFDRPRELSVLEPSCAFLVDESGLRARLWSVALSRFPFESLPLLRFCQALCIPDSNVQHDIAATLQNVETLTVVHNEAIAQLSSVQNGEESAVSLGNETDLMALQFPFLIDRSLEFHQTLKSSRTRGLLGSFMLPARTLGQVVSNGKPTVVAWQHPYSLYTYFSLVIKLAFDQRSNPREAVVGAVFETCTQVIGVLAALMFPCDSSQYDRDQGLEQGLRQSVLQRPVSDSESMASLILDLFESQLYRGALTFNDSVPSDFLTNCIRFIYSLSFADPKRVWSFLANSSLLGVKGSESRLMSAVSNLELPTGQYNLLTSSLRLFRALLRNAVTYSGTKHAESRALTRFREEDLTKDGHTPAPDTIKKVLLNFTRISVDAFESSRGWKFASIEERIDLNIHTCNVFDEILETFYGVDDASDSKSKLSTCLAPAAEYLVEVFLVRSNTSLAAQALLDLILEGLETPVSTIFLRNWLKWQSQTRAALKLGTRLMRLGRLLDRRQTRLEQQLFDHIQPLTRLYAAYSSYRLGIVELLNSLVHGEGEDGGRPRSLLNSIEQTNMRCFIDVLSHFDHPFVRPSLEIAIWKLLSNAVSYRQQWFALYLLNGKSPREWLQSQDWKTGGTGIGRPMFRIALVQLAKIDDCRLVKAIGVLDFIASATDFSPGAMELLEKHGKLDSALKIVSSLKTPSAQSQVDPRQSPHLHFQAASSVVRILAMLEHYCNEKYVQREDKPPILQGITRSLNFLLNEGAKRPAYNVSLHDKLRRNFEQKFPGHKLASFKKTPLNPPLLGMDFFYDLDAMRLFLHKHPGWNDLYDHSISHEIVRSNLNLSLVQAQVNLFYAWKLLVGELDQEVREMTISHNYYIIIMKSCLEANQQGRIPERFFEDLAQARADIALMLAQRFTRQTQRDEKIIDVLHLAWKVIQENAPSIGDALTSTDAEYVRTLLKLLYLLLGASATIVSSRDTWDRAKDETDVGLALDVLDKVASQPFRTLINALHNNPSKIMPADFAMINALLRSCLHFPGVDRHPQALCAMFVDNGAVRLASTLLSWADQLAVNGDPVYGEISTDYLVELSRVSILAESMLVGGFLDEMLTARLFQLYRRPGGIGPFEEPARMYSIWTRGMLPLLINILSAVGAPAASDISTFLNLFQPQLERASGSFDLGAPTQPRKTSAGGITLAMASEAQSLSLLAAILTQFREAGASAGIVGADVAELPWDGAAVRLDLETLLQRQNTLRAQLVPLGAREEAWARERPTSSGSKAESRYEEMVVKDMGTTLSLLGSDDE